MYGALPPEARSQQALLFNTARTGYNVLSASNAVGMGLNLNIRYAPLPQCHALCPPRCQCTPLQPLQRCVIGEACACMSPVKDPLPSKG